MAESSRQRILRKALKLFAKRGYAATSVREVCEASGITKPTLYHFFKSKEGVWRALVDGALEEFRRDIVAAVGSPPQARDRLKRVAQVHFAKAREERELARFILGLVHGPSGAAPATDFPRYYEGLVGLVARVVDEGVARRELVPGPTPVRMLVLMGAIGEALHGYLIAGRPELTPNLADTLVDVILEGWVA